MNTFRLVNKARVVLNSAKVVFAFKHTMPNYPKIRRDPKVIDNYHGIEVADPYRWLEDPDSAETKAFVELQNSITTPYINACPYKSQIYDRLTALWNYPKYMVPSLHGNKYYQFRNSGLQNQSVLYVQDTLYSEGQVFLDPNEFSDDGTVALSHHEFTQDGKHLAYGVSSCGSDWLEVRFRNTETGHDLEDVLQKVKYSFVAWSHDNNSCFYGAYLEQEGKTDGSETNESKNQKLYYHKLGTAQSEDIVVVEFEDPQIRSHANVSHCGNYLVLTPVKGCKNNLLYFCNLQSVGEIKEKLPIVPVVTEFTADFEFITNDGTNFIFRTNKDAPNYRLVSIDFTNPSESNWKTLIPAHENDVLEWAKPIDNDKLVVCYLRDVKDVLLLYKLENGEKILEFPLEVGSISGVSGEKKDTSLFFRFTSFLTPSIIYHVDFKDPKYKAKILHETKVGDFDSSKFASRQVFYNSKDGTRIPMFVVHKKGIVLDGSNPCLLYGYGGFNVSIGPLFSVYRLIFMDNFDGVFAIANIRGGGEYGENWHNAGRFGNKQNVFDDFQYAAHYLIDNGYTSPSKLTIQGGSNGGLLVAACINQAPQLFGCAICMVGVLDMLRYHKFTIAYAWKSDYGCSDDTKDFEYLYKYSPLHNVQIPADSGEYPATLLLTADHDDRVVPIHSYKFIAELQDKIGKLPQQKQPLLIRIDTKAGHGAGKPTSKMIEEYTEILAFMQKSLNLDYHN